MAKKQLARGGRPIRDRHVLYEASVQNAEAEVDFFEKVYKRRHAKRFERLREDFCATAAIACDWARRRPENRSWGVDFHEPTLAWGRRHHVARLGAAAERVTLLLADVRDVRKPEVDVVAALNFSYWVFKERKVLVDYFRGVRASLRAGGMLVLDAYGGTDAMGTITERRRVSGHATPDGAPIPAFSYVWEQAYFNPVDHHMTNFIHFELGDGTKLKRAFRYDWRQWTLPELKDALLEAGFAATEVWMDGWNDELDEGDGLFRPTRKFANDLGWVAYVVAYV